MENSCLWMIGDWRMVVCGWMGERRLFVDE